MFTGLVEAVGQVIARAPTAGGVRVRLATPLAAELSLGDSLAVNGVCLTVVETGADSVDADIGPETLRVTTLGGVGIGTAVNLERPVRADSRFGGHFVQGHVDAVGTITELRADADFHRLHVSFPAGLAPYFIPKGSVAIDGISLTVASLFASHFEVMIIPFTLEHTNLKFAKTNDHVNLECDMVGKYVVRATEVAGLSFSADERGATQEGLVR